MSHDRAIELEAWFNQSPAEVYEAWIEPQQLAAWFAAGKWAVDSVTFTAAIGANWRITFKHPSGHHYVEEGVVLTVIKNELLEFTLTQVGLTDQPFETRITVSFEPDRGGTLVRFRQIGFPNDATRDGNRKGWESCLEKLRERLKLGQR